MRTARQQRERVQQVRNSAGLTVTKATREARRIVDAAMPGVQMMTVNTRRSYDFGVQADVMITTITFPPMPVTDPRPWHLYGELSKLPGIIEPRGRTADSSIVITRMVK